MATEAERLPYGVGHATLGWTALAAGLGAVVGFGIFAYLRELAEGLSATGLGDLGPAGGTPWGLYIAFVVYFAGVSFAGITVAAIIRLGNLKRLRPIARMAELLTVVALVLAGLTVIADLGQPLRGVINLFRYARPQSPFFGTFTIVISGYLFASLVYVYLDGRRDAALCARSPGRLRGFHRWWAAGYTDTPAERERHQRASFWMAIGILPLLVVATSTLGFVFGLQVGRPGWYSALQAPAFVILAGASGLGLLIVVAAIARRVLGIRRELNITIFRWLGNALMLLLLAYVYFMAVEVLTGVYAAHHHEVRLTKALLFGPYAIVFWPSVALLTIPLAMLLVGYLRKQTSIPVLVVAGLMVNLGAMGKRYLIVVPSQTHAALLPYEVGSYTPAWTEVGVITGLIALGALMYIVFAKVFPLLDVRTPEGAA